MFGWSRTAQYITPIGLFYKNWGFYLEAPQAGLEPATR